MWEYDNVSFHKFLFQHIICFLYSFLRRRRWEEYENKIFHNFILSTYYAV